MQSILFPSCKRMSTFASALAAFCEDLLPTFPELTKEITAVQARPVADVEKEFVALWKSNPAVLTLRDATYLFSHDFWCFTRLVLQSF
jgi:hypothetical protein